MNDLMSSLIHFSAMLLALLYTPWLMVRLIIPRRRMEEHLLLWGPALVLLNFTIPVALHGGSFPIDANTLSLAHILAAMLATSLFLLFRHPFFPDVSLTDAFPWALFGSLVILVFPFTHLTGIDTYKWQDLASAVQVEQSIPWFVHPLALFGYAPRSYPSAYPLLLSTIDILGHTGVDWGFFLASVIVAMIALTGAWYLGFILFGNRRWSFWFAAAYVFSPVFIRYTHWATGRGLFLALLPAFLWILLARREFWLKRLGLGLVVMLLLFLSHKAALVGIPIILVAFFLQWIPRLCRPIPLVLLLIVSMAMGLLLSPGHGAPWHPSHILSALKLLPSRFGVLLPLALIGLWKLESRFDQRYSTFIAVGFLATLPLSCLGDMYGALIALPFMALCAIAGVDGIIQNTHIPEFIRRYAFSIVAVLLGTGAVAIVAHRSLTMSTSPDIYAIAQFLERHDPQGPFIVEAPGRARQKIQGYVSGCPRFQIGAPPAGRIHILPPPSRKGSWLEQSGVWIRYLRSFLMIEDISVSWYGNNPRRYVVVLGEAPPAPAGCKLLFSHGTAHLFAPINQTF